MRNLFILLLVLATSCSRDTKTTLQFNIQDYNGTNPRVIIGWDNRSVSIDSISGKGTLTLDLSAPTYALVEVRKYDRKLCFLEPGKDLTVTYSQKKGEKQVTYGGASGKEAEFLNQGNYSFISINSTERDVQKAARKVDSILEVNLRKVETIPFSATFKEWEAKRQHTEAFAALLRFPIYSLMPDSASTERTEYLNLLHDQLATDSTYLSIPSYREALEQYVRRLISFSRQDSTMPEGNDLADARLNVIFANITEPAALAYIIDQTLFHLAEQGIEKYEQIYRQHVKDPARLALYNEACKKADRIAPGQPCPDFTFKDNEGKDVSLTDLKGKFVYIDMWATWCGPCKGEMPSLLKLEEEFAGKDILFVSLSIDRNKDIELWKKTIKEMDLGGIQLHLGENWEWLKIFMPASMSVPRFVLLDREGKIINANMSRPSDKATAAKFRELLNL